MTITGRVVQGLMAVTAALTITLGGARATEVVYDPLYVVFRLPPPPAYAKAATVIARAERGDVRAQTYLGFMYQTGRGVPQHFGRAVHWYEVAANRGDGNAQFALGLLYNTGQGVPMDFVTAYMWFNLSTSQASGEMRKFKTRVRDAVASKMSDAQIVAAQQLADAWYGNVLH